MNIYIVSFKNVCCVSLWHIEILPNTNVGIRWLKDLKGVCLLHLSAENMFLYLEEHLILCFDGEKIDLKPLIMLFLPNLFLLLSVMMCAKIGNNMRSDKGRPSKQEKFRDTIKNNLIKYYHQIINSLL